METLLGLLIVLLGLALAVVPWSAGRTVDAFTSALVTGAGVAAILFGLALSHRALDVWRSHRSRR